jgi:hypothetical protein
VIFSSKNIYICLGAGSLHDPGSQDKKASENMQLVFLIFRYSAFLHKDLHTAALDQVVRWLLTVLKSNLFGF